MLLRHGQSEFNRLNLFTGWLDVGLSTLGIKEATTAGEKLKDIRIDSIFTSSLTRAQQTAMLFMTATNNNPAVITSKTEHNQSPVETDISTDNYTPMICDWRLNERHYGKLQGMNKQEAAEIFGKEQVALWRRGFDTPPPEGESLKMTLARVTPALKDLILPKLAENQNILVVAHGNSLRSLVMEIENISPEDIVNLEIATAKPIIYNFAEGKFSPEAN